MTTTLRPTGPLQHDADGIRRQHFRVCVNSRPVGEVEVSTDARYGPTVGRIDGLRVEQPDQRRGRATVAALAAEEVLRGWRCERAEVSVPADATPALALVRALGYVERNRTLRKQVPAEPPALPEGSAGRPMTEAEYAAWAGRTAEEYVAALMSHGVAEGRARELCATDHWAALGDGVRNPDAWLEVLEHDGTPVGTLWVALTPDQALVVLVEVAPEHRGRGHGRSLMLLAEQRARAAGRGALRLNVFADNTPAVWLYASLGYEPVVHHLFKPL
ncbi:GNAT family N-acetyltransferase [Streptomyces sp. NPDC060194]|uniref:GNAT family N-acetyltransferase n=1 Tax=Streptomyces sp. NPDC060194 TaxID=3347069 RepID=UPI003666743D